MVTTMVDLDSLPHLSNRAAGLHPDNGTWQQYLNRCELMDTTKLDVDDGWSWYRRVNCNYFVSPAGFVYKDIFGYHGLNVWCDLVSGDKYKELQ